MSISPKSLANLRRGAPKGPRKVTMRAREAIAALVDYNAERMQGWLDQIALEDGPLVAWKCMQDVIEYHIPKLSRTELTGPAGGPVTVTLAIQFDG